MVGDQPVILRPGMISSQALEYVIGKLVISPAKVNNKIQVSGSLPSHYAPDTPVRLLTAPELLDYLNSSKTIRNKSIAYLTFSTSLAPKAKNLQIFEMPPDAKAYARCLYEIMYQVDALGFEEIIVERPPQDPSWIAILDRLTKASYKSGEIKPDEELA